MNIENRKFGALSSSEDPQKFSETIASVLKIVGYLVSAYASISGTNVLIDDAQMQALTQAFIAIASAGMIIYQSGQFIFGFVRKLALKFKK